jgi:hypothetical protein
MGVLALAAQWVGTETSRSGDLSCSIEVANCHYINLARYLLQKGKHTKTMPLRPVPAHWFNIVSNVCDDIICGQLTVEQSKFVWFSGCWFNSQNNDEFGSALESLIGAEVAADYDEAPALKLLHT